MTDRSPHGYASAIGASANNLSQLALLTVAKDIKAARNVLVPDLPATLPESAPFIPPPLASLLSKLPDARREFLVPAVST